MLRLWLLGDSVWKEKSGKSSHEVSHMDKISWWESSAVAVEGGFLVGKRSWTRTGRLLDLPNGIKGRVSECTRYFLGGEPEGEKMRVNSRRGYKEAEYTIARLDRERKPRERGVGPPSEILHALGNRSRMS